MANSLVGQLRGLEGQIGKSEARISKEVTC